MSVTFPASANQRGDREINDALRCDGTLPISLRGSVFGVAPTGHWNPNTPFLNGDPLFYRVDFDGGVARLRTRLGGGVGPALERAARAQGSAWEFRDFGITRLSAKLGARDFSNTALLPVRRAGGGAALLATYDAGRPHYLDPSTLALLAPLSPQREWRANLLMARPFKQVFSTAHPCFDEATGELFVVNHGRSLQALASRLFAFVRTWLPWTPGHDRTPGESLDDLIDSLRNAYEGGAGLLELPGRALSAAARRVAAAVTGIPTGVTSLRERLAFARWLKAFLAMLKDFTREGPVAGEAPHAPFTYLLRWAPDGSARRYELRRGDAPVQVLESAHQMALNRDWVIFVDAAFKMEIDGITSVPEDTPLRTLVAFRREVSQAQSHTARFYFVRRADLDRDDLPDNGHPSFPAAVVQARCVEIPGEVVHFHVDLAPTPEGHVTLFAVHQNGMDGAEFVLRGDRRYDGAALPPEVFGTFPASMSLNAVGRHEVDPDGERVVTSRVVSSADLGWALGLTAGPGINTAGATQPHLTELYVYSQGLVPDQLTALIYELYERYPHRAARDLQRLLAKGGAPAALLRIDLREMRIVEHFVVADDQQVVSPQYVPDPAGPGWVVCNVFSGERSIAAGARAREIWVFAADAIAAGPRCRLWHPELDWGYTLHTVWMPEAPATPTDGLVSLEADLGEWVRDREFGPFYERYLRGA